MRRGLGFLGLAVLLPIAVAAQAPRRFTTVVEDMHYREFATIRGDFVAAAEQMPAEHYRFKIVDTVRSFGEEVAHATAVNRRLCTMASGATASPAPPAPDAGQSKDALVEALKSSFAQCEGVLAASTDQSILTPTTGPYIRASHLTAMLGHNNEVYGKLTLMLRAKGLVPPSTARQKR